MSAYVRGSPATTKSYGLPVSLISWTRGYGGHLVEILQVRNFEGLHVYGVASVAIPIGVQPSNERLLERKPDPVEIGWVLRFGVIPTPSRFARSMTSWKVGIW